MRYHTATLGLSAFCGGLVFGWAALFCGPSVQGSDSSQLPSLSIVTSTVRKHFVELKNRRPGDLISRSDVEPILAELEQQGWVVSDEAQILSAMLDSGHFLVRTLHSRDGKQFMRQVLGYKLIYDRLDRISAESGGQRLIRDMIKLPDGAKYAKLTPPRGVPAMTDFLPKNRSGKSRRVPDYRKPTGRIYTQVQLLERLTKSYGQDSRQLKRR